MKLKINKACDINSISVLPPHGRRPTTSTQASQLRSQQQSQQSFSQGLSSQHCMFSQISQNSLDEIGTNDQSMQRYSSQDRENPGKKLAIVNHTREESQMPISRNSTNIIRKWGTTTFSDNKCQIAEEVERRIGLMEASLSKLGMVLDSVQSDVMQVNKGTKEVYLEMETLRQKLMLHDNSLQLLSKGQDDIKTSLDGCFKTMSDQLSKSTHEDKLQEVFSILSGLSEHIKKSKLELQDHLCNNFTREIQALITVLKRPSQNSASPFVINYKSAGVHATPHRELRHYKNPAAIPDVHPQVNFAPKTEMGEWRSVKMEQATTIKASGREHTRKEVPSQRKLIKQEKESRLLIELDEEIDGGFSCLLDGKETGSIMIDEVTVETERILRKARRRKRKCCNPIVIN